MPSTPYPMAHGGPAVHGGGPMPMGAYPQVAAYPPRKGRRSRSSKKKIVWWVIALLAIGAGVGTAMATWFR